MINFKNLIIIEIIFVDILPQKLLQTTVMGFSHDQYSLQYVSSIDLSFRHANVLRFY